MFWMLATLLLQPAFAQDNLDLEAVRKLGDDLPAVIEYSEPPTEIEKRKSQPKHYHPYRQISLKSILNSGIEKGHLKAGTTLIRLSDNKNVEVTEEFYVNFFRLQDDQGFKYLQSEDGSCKYKIRTEFFNSVEPELALYEPPLRYTPAPTNIIRSDYDKKLQILPEVTFLLGRVQGNYMKDLFNDAEASSGTTTQFGVHFATKWKLPVKAGAVVHYERTTYGLTGGSINYNSFSFGPQFKTKDFDSWFGALRFQTQFRVSPLARAIARNSTQEASFKFNSADLLLSAEHPFKNRFGEFVIGVFFQSQWLSIKDQPELVSLSASNKPNESLGLSLAQVFE